MKRLLFIIILCILASSVSATGISSKFYIEYDKVLSDTHILYDSPVDDVLNITLPMDARAITLQVDNIQVNPNLEYNILKYKLNNNSKVRIQYISEAYIESNSFIGNIIPPVDADEFIIRITLPEEAILKTSMKGNIPSILPKPRRLETDGRIISVVWRMENVTAGEELPVIINYNEPVNPMWFVIPVILIIILIPLTIALVKKRPHKEPEKPEFKIEKHLKEDEEQVITILKDREGECEQGTLRVITGFSKAKLSGLLKELEERNVLHREKRGKKNRVFLR